MLPPVLAGAPAALLRLPLLVDLVEDGQGGRAQLGTGPRPAQLPAARTGVAQLEPSRGTVACRDTEGQYGGTVGTQWWLVGYEMHRNSNVYL